MTDDHADDRPGRSKPRRFTMTGTLRGNPGVGRVSVTWEAGWLTGDPAAVAAMEATAADLEGQPVGTVPGPYTEGNHLANALSTVCIAADWVFDRESLALAGQVPTASYKPGRVY